MSRRVARAQRIATGEHPVVSSAEPVLLDDETAEHVPTVELQAPSAGSARLAEPQPAAGEVAVPAVDEFHLVEQVVDPASVAPAPAPPAAASGVDEFEAAARLFAFTGETPVQAPSADTAEASEDAPQEAARQPRRNRVTALKRATATTFSIGVVGIVGLLAVGMTTPAQAVAAMNGTAAGADLSVRSDIVTPAGDSLAIDRGEIQAYVTPAGVESASLDRPETYATATLADLAAELGIRNPSNFYVNDPNAAIQWPFAVGVGISWGFQWRDGRHHNGADFTPGEGAHIQAIADGTVRIATENGGSFGVTIVIDHIIDGQLISSRYAHMLVGSMQVKVGDHVKVGQFLGRTGNTGFSIGAHTHVEILANGTTPIDPIAWFRANAGRDSLG